VRIAAELDPEAVEPDQFAEPFCPEEVRGALVQRDDVVVMDVGQNPFLFAPDARPVGPFGGLVAVFEQAFALRCARACMSCLTSSSESQDLQR